MLFTGCCRAGKRKKSRKLGKRSTGGYEDVFFCTGQNARYAADATDERRQISSVKKVVPALDQVTVNEYPPDAAWPHVDTHSEL